MARDFTTTTLNYPQGADTPIKRVIVDRPPKTGTVDSDYKNFTPGDEWLDTSNYDWWKFVRVSGSPAIGIWVLLGNAGNIEFLTGNSGGPVDSDPANNINILGSGIVNVSGNPGTNTLTITSSGAGTLTGNSGGAVPPSAGNNINIVGTGSVNVIGTPGTNTLSISVIDMGITWKVITVNQMAVKDEGYFTVAGGVIQVQLPAVSVIGDTFEVADMGGGLFQITQGAGQQVRLGNQMTTIGVGGSITSILNGSHLELVCFSANVGWMALEPNGNFIIV